MKTLFNFGSRDAQFSLALVDPKNQWQGFISINCLEKENNGLR
jgi:hypothetical protein